MLVKNTNTKIRIFSRFFVTLSSYFEKHGLKCPAQALFL